MLVLALGRDYYSFEALNKVHHRAKLNEQVFIPLNNEGCLKLRERIVQKVVD